MFLRQSKLSLIVLFFLSTSLVRAQSDFSAQEIMDKYQKIESLLAGYFSAPSTCTQLSSDLLGDQCSFAGFCQAFQGNIDKAYLYESEEGGKVPNYKLFRLNQLARSCYANKFMSAKERESSQEEGSSIREALLRQSRARLELRRVVLEKNVTEDFHKFVMATINADIEELEKGDEDAQVFQLAKQSRKTAEEIAREFKDLSRKAGVKLPEAVQTAYVNSVLAQQQSKEDNIITSASGNPFLLPELFTFFEIAGSEEIVRENQKKLVAAEERMKEIFSTTQKRMLAFLEDRKSIDPLNAAKYDVMTTRITTINYEPMNPNNLRAMSQFCPGPNAFYRPSDHTFQICPQIMELPTKALEFVIAHELGHSIDPCNLSQNFAQAKNLVFHSHMKPKELTSEQKERRSELLKAEGILVYDFNQDTSSEIYLTDMFGGARSALNEVFSGYSFNTIVNGIPFVENPTFEVSNCLSGSSSVGARTSAKDLAYQNLVNGIEKLKQSGAREDDPSRVRLINLRDNFDDLFNQVGGCSFLPGNSQLQEAWSDWIATKTHGQEPLSYREGFESLTFFLGMNCQMGKPSVQDEVESFMKELGCMEDDDNLQGDLSIILQQERESEGVHSHGIDRLERIILSHPQYRSALGCKKNEEVVHCE